MCYSGHPNSYIVGYLIQICSECPNLPSERTQFLEHNIFTCLLLYVSAGFGHYLADFTTTYLEKNAEVEACPLQSTLRPQAARLLRSWVRIPPGEWIFVCCECRVLSGRGLCDELITRPEESSRLWCAVVCVLETSRIGAPYIHSISSLRVNLIHLLLNIQSLI